MSRKCANTEQLWGNLTDHQKSNLLAFRERYRETQREKVRDWCMRDYHAHPEKYELKSARHRALIQGAVNRLKLEMSRDGMCSWSAGCTVPSDRCDIHHLDDSLKGRGGVSDGNFGDMHTLHDIEEEVARNTDEDGNILLHTLCAYHHRIHHHEQTDKPGSADRLQHTQRRWVNAYKRALRTCEYEDCRHPQDVCVKGNEFAFDMAHLHRRDEWQQPGSTVLREECKLYRVGNMVAHAMPLEEIEAECAKCRLMHPDCRRHGTKKQSTGSKRKRSEIQ